LSREVHPGLLWLFQAEEEDIIKDEANINPQEEEEKIFIFPLLPHRPG